MPDLNHPDLWPASEENKALFAHFVTRQHFRYRLCFTVGFLVILGGTAATFFLPNLPTLFTISYVIFSFLCIFYGALQRTHLHSLVLSGELKKIIEKENPPSP